MMLAIFSFGLGVGFALLVVAAAVTLHVRRRGSFARVPLVDDAVIEQIIERGEIYIDDEELDLDAIDDEEDRFWSESWDEPSGDW
jgi:hypothetical protein